MSIGGHQSHTALKDEWLTPPDLLKALGCFDLDPCAPVSPPWQTAKIMYSILFDGLTAPWQGRVWLNPPYGAQTGRWLKRLADHGDGVALIFARTETAHWFDQVWPRATAVNFLRGRLHFHHVSGERAKHNSGAPSALVAYGRDNGAALSAVDGRVVWLNDQEAA